MVHSSGSLPLALLLFILVTVLRFQGTESYSRYSEDTRYALTEMNRILRHLFPVMPERGTHYLWPDNIPRSADQYVGDNEAVRSKQSSKLDPQLARDGERSEAESVKEEAEAVAAILSSMEQGGDDSSPQSSLDGKASMVSEVKWSSGARGTNGPVGGKSGNVLPRIYQSRPMSMTSGSGGSDGGHWRVSSSSLGKRGPECMRKCIAQGVLHPVQCHSLC